MIFTLLIDVADDRTALETCLTSIRRQEHPIAKIMLWCPADASAELLDAARRASAGLRNLEVIETPDGARSSAVRARLAQFSSGYLIVMDSTEALTDGALKALALDLSADRPAVVITSWNSADDDVHGRSADDVVAPGRDLLNEPWVDGLLLLEHSLVARSDLPAPFDRFSRWELCSRLAESETIRFVEGDVCHRPMQARLSRHEDLRRSRRGNDIRRAALTRRGLVRTSDLPDAAAARMAALLVMEQAANDVAGYNRWTSAGLALLIGPAELRLVTLSELLFGRVALSATADNLVVFPGQDEPLHRVTDAVACGPLALTLVVGDREEDRRAARLYNCYFDQVCFLSAESELSVSSHLWSGCPRERTYQAVKRAASYAVTGRQVRPDSPTCLVGLS